MNALLSELNEWQIDALVVGTVGLVAWVLFVKAPSILHRDPTPEPPPLRPQPLPDDDDGEIP